MSFSHSIFRVYCHVWVKLCSEQLCGFCTSCSPIVCGKLPLQLVISQFNMPPLYLSIIIRYKRIENKIAQSQNQSAKLATTKHIMNASYNGEDAYARSKRKSQFVNETVQCSQPGPEEEPHKAKLFQEELLRKKNIATLHTLLTNKPASMERGIHSSPTRMIG